MPKQRNRFRLKSGQKPYLFYLPREMRKVKHWAFMAGILNAFNAWPMRPESETEMFIGAAAIESALMWEQAIVKGKSGTNEPVLFRQTFSDFCALIHPAVTRLFLAEPKVYKSMLGLSEEKRVDWAYEMAEQYLSEVEQLIAEGKPIVFLW